MPRPLKINSTPGATVSAKASICDHPRADMGNTLAKPGQQRTFLEALTIKSETATKQWVERENHVHKTSGDGHVAQDVTLRDPLAVALLPSYDSSKPQTFCHTHSWGGSGKDILSREHVLVGEHWSWCACDALRKPSMTKPLLRGMICGRVFFAAWYDQTKGNMSDTYRTQDLPLTSILRSKINPVLILRRWKAGLSSSKPTMHVGC